MSDTGTAYHHSTTSDDPFRTENVTGELTGELISATTWIDYVDLALKAPSLSHHASRRSKP